MVWAWRGSRHRPTHNLRPAQERKSYLLFPIRTQLQREFLFKKNMRFLLVVNCDEMTDTDRKIDSRRLNFEDKDFEAVNVWRSEIDSIGYELFAEKGCETLGASRGGFDHRFDARSGFDDTKTIGTISGDSDWKSMIKMLGDKRGLITENLDENGAGDESVRAYPVRTILSRNSANDVDLVISFPQVLEKDIPEKLDEKTVAKVKSLVASLKLKEIKQMNVSFFLKPGLAPKGYDRFNKATGTKQLSESLGVKNYWIGQRYRD